MNKSWLKFFFSAPAAAVIYVPLALVMLEYHGFPKIEGMWWGRLLGFLLLWGGVALVMWAYNALIKDGGAEAKFNLPTKKLVKDGPYRYIRNPMSVGIMIILFGEALYFSSWYLFFWALIVSEIMAYYITHVEEYKLVNKFGQEYISYKMDVGKWLPKWDVLKSWLKRK